MLIYAGIVWLVGAIIASITLLGNEYEKNGYGGVVRYTVKNRSGEFVKITKQAPPFPIAAAWIIFWPILVPVAGLAGIRRLWVLERDREREMLLEAREKERKALEEQYQKAKADLQALLEEETVLDTQQMEN